MMSFWKRFEDMQDEQPGIASGQLAGSPNNLVAKLSQQIHPYYCVSRGGWWLYRNNLSPLKRPPSLGVSCGVHLMEVVTLSLQKLLHLWGMKIWASVGFEDLMPITFICQGACERGGWRKGRWILDDSSLIRWMTVASFGECPTLKHMWELNAWFEGRHQFSVCTSVVVMFSEPSYVIKSILSLCWKQTQRGIQHFRKDQLSIQSLHKRSLFLCLPFWGHELQLTTHPGVFLPSSFDPRPWELGWHVTYHLMV